MIYYSVEEDKIFIKRPTGIFKQSIWGLGTEQEQGYRTGPPDYIGWRNSFLGIESWAS